MDPQSPPPPPYSPPPPQQPGQWGTGAPPPQVPYTPMPQQAPPKRRSTGIVGSIVATVVVVGDVNTDHVVSVAGEAFNAWQVRRGRRIALSQLLEFEPHRLDDIGVTIQDIEDARILGAPIRPSKRREW